jgi:hypothetical protein
MGKETGKVKSERVRHRSSGRVKLAMTSPEGSRVHTAAWIAFESNLDMIGHLVYFGSREVSQLGKLSRGLKSGVASRLAELSENPTPATIESLTAFLNETNAGIAGIQQRMQTGTQWQLVALVTCIEAYLQDALQTAASLDVELMSRSEQVARYEEVISATSLDELASELRRRWARRWLEGGPAGWISRLQKMGARGYPDDLSSRLELMWGIRHNIVHSAGFATADLLKRHLDAAKGLGDRIQVGNRRTAAFFKSAPDFLEPTEKFFLARYPALQVPLSSKATN